MAGDQLELVFLGTGTSAGVPMIGCDCAVCRSDDPRDQRTRPSALIRYPDGRAHAGPRQLLIDTTPDIRLQAVREHIDRIDGVLYTHAHADHIFGIDDLRRFNAVMKRPVDVYGEPSLIAELQQMFRYIFQPGRNVNPSFVAELIPCPLHVGRALELFGAVWTPIRLMHGRLPILGFRVDWRGRSLAYCTDVSTIPPETYPLLTGLDVLVIDALRYRHHPTHLTVDQALGIIDELKPGRAYFTHMAHDIRHAEIEAALPEAVHPAYDGLRVTLEAATPTRAKQIATDEHR